MEKITIERNKDFFEELCADILLAETPDYWEDREYHEIVYATIYIDSVYVDGLYGLEPKKYNVYASYYAYNFGIYDDLGVSASKNRNEGYDRYYNIGDEPIIAKVIKGCDTGSNFKEIKELITKECELLLKEVEKGIMKIQ